MASVVETFPRALLVGAVASAVSLVPVCGGSLGGGGREAKLY